MSLAASQQRLTISDQLASSLRPLRQGHNHMVGMFRFGSSVSRLRYLPRLLAAMTLLASTTSVIAGCRASQEANGAVPAYWPYEHTTSRTFVVTTAKIPVQDGTHLGADLFLPPTPGRYPVVVAITPYGRHGGYNLGRRLAHAGFAALLVDARGRGDSDGTFDMWDSGNSDPEDVVAWASNASFSDGQVAMWGSSYSGTNQWRAAYRQADGLRTIAPGAADYPGISFPMKGDIGYPYSARWAAYVSGKNSNGGLFADSAYWDAVYRDQLEAGLPFSAIDELSGFDTELFDIWANNPPEGSYWASVRPTPTELANVRIPILTTTGLYDGAQPGALKFYKDHIASASEQAADQHFLVIGPYDHAGVVFPKDNVGGLSVPESGGIDPIDLHIQWYDWVMRGAAPPAFLKDRVAYYVMGDGANNWRYASSLDTLPSTPTSFFLSSPDESPISLQRAGQLSPSRNDLPLSKVRYISDPSDLSKAYLGNWFSGAFNRHNEDVAAIDGEGFIFETEPYSEPTELIGFPNLEAWISINTPDTDFQVRLYEVLPDQTVIYLTESRLRARYRDSDIPALLNSLEPELYEFDSFGFLSRRIAKGSRLRLVISAPNSIHIQRNYNTAEPVAEQTIASAQPVIVEMTLGSEKGARLVLPLSEVKVPAKD